MLATKFIHVKVHHMVPRHHSHFYFPPALRDVTFSVHCVKIHQFSQSNDFQSFCVCCRGVCLSLCDLQCLIKIFVFLFYFIFEDFS